MQQRDRLNQTQRPVTPGETGAGDSVAAAAVATAARIAAAVEGVAERVLSGNSQGFLQATEQHGGQ